MAKNAFLYHYKATILEIIDGDTVKIMLDLGMRLYAKTYCRLADINAPELSSNDAAIKASAEKSKKHLSKLLKVNSVVFIDSKRLDKYGRSLAVITTEAGVNINEEMLKSGNAVKYK